MQKGARKIGRPFVDLRRLVVAATTEYYNDGEDHDPSAVIVKDVAQAVIHYVCLRELLCGSRRLVSYYARRFFWLIEAKYDLSVLYYQLARKALAGL